MLSGWFAERREKAALFKTNLTEEAELTLHMRHANMGTLTVQHIDSNSSYVTGWDFNCMVDLEKVWKHRLSLLPCSHLSQFWFIHFLFFLQRSCTCKQYDLEKIPCEHAIKVAKCRNIVEATGGSSLHKGLLGWSVHRSYKPYKWRFDPTSRCT